MKSLRKFLGANDDEDKINNNNSNFIEEQKKQKLRKRKKENYCKSSRSWEKDSKLIENILMIL